MSSSPERRRTSLRRRLITEQLALLAVICLIIGAVTELALGWFLVGNLDEQVTAASERAARFVGPGPGPEPPDGERPRPRPDPLEARGVSTGTISALVVDGRIRVASRLSEDADAESLPSDLKGTLLDVPADGEARTVTVGDLGDYRVVALRSDRGDVVITGLPLAGVHETLLTVGLIMGGVALAGLAITGFSGALVIRRTLRPLERMAQTAGKVTELPLHTGEVALPVRVPDADTDPDTEVGRVGAALNRMLGHVGDALAARHASETRVRQFVADASHELRTPLASISGYAELARRGDAPVPAEVAHALRRVESEAARMTTLVEDMLLLARIDAGRPLEHAETDLSRIVVDAVSDARAAGRDHHWRLELPPEPVTLTGDGHRLQQVLVNLLANARTHTPAGTTVRTALSTSDGQATLTVTDDGPGIPAELRPTVFERFARGAASRSRTAGSTGLGLAIVHAVVTAHRGSVAVDSAPGRTVFTVHLPLTATAQ